MLVNVSMKFHEGILNGLIAIEWTQFVTDTANYKVQRGITISNNIYPRVMVLTLCTLSNVD